MNISEAAAVNVVCRALLGNTDAVQPQVDEDAFVSALSTLAERASKALLTGYTGGMVVARRDRAVRMFRLGNLREQELAAIRVALKRMLRRTHPPSTASALDKLSDDLRP